MIQIWQVCSECGPSNLVVLGLVDARISDSEKDLPVFVVDFLSLKPY